MSLIMDYRKQLLEAVEVCCARTGLARATIATKVVNDGKFFDRIEAGGGFTMRTFEAFIRFFEQNAGGAESTAKLKAGKQLPAREAPAPAAKGKAA